MTATLLHPEADSRARTAARRGDAFASRAFLRREAWSLLGRLTRFRPFALTMPAPAAGGVGEAARLAVERHLFARRRELRGAVRDYLRWLQSPAGEAAAPTIRQRRFTVLRMRFNLALDQSDIFAAGFTQRAEHGTGVWLAGLDAMAADALELGRAYYEPPPVMVYLDRGHGAAIRRARTRLPGGDFNPVAVIRLPRERMVGAGIGSSLVHEAGHQAAALLDLNDTLRAAVRARGTGGPWALWAAWVSEIVADFWASAALGVSATTGLMAVVSLPRPFVFRIAAGDPHPMPWVRVMLSAAVGRRLYPDPQWNRIEQIWNSFYPILNLPPRTDAALRGLLDTREEFVNLMLNHRPPRLGGRSLAGAMPLAERTPARLRSLYKSWLREPERIRDAAPTLAFAAVSQAGVDGLLSASKEGETIARLLDHWAVSRALPPTSPPPLPDSDPRAPAV